MLEHRDEIYARPKRTWFMTEKEKKLVAQAEKVIFLFPELVVVERRYICLNHPGYFLFTGFCREPYWRRTS